MLDVAIGLVLVFLLVSLMLTAVCEAIEAVLRTRAKDLTRSIYELMQRDSNWLDELYKHPVIAALHRAAPDSKAWEKVVLHVGNGGQGWLARCDPRLKVQRYLARRQLPAYISRESFSLAMIDLWQRDPARTGDVMTALGAIDRVAGGEIGRRRAEIEGWYDAAMDRAAGYFKRRTQGRLLILGLITALALNVNAVTIGNYLATDQQAREFAADFAATVPKPGSGEDVDVATLYKGLEETVGLPIGWSRSTVLKMQSGDWDSLSERDRWLAGLKLGIGYIITALAAMLGAPLWFDVLNRIMVIRSTVKPKEKSPDEPSQDGGAAK